MNNEIELKNAVEIRAAMEEYQDTVYLNLMRQVNTECQNILREDMGSEFVRCCGRDIAGEIVRNCFDTSSYSITVDQLAKRILEFSYDDEYDPLAGNGGIGEIQKAVYNYNELQSGDLDMIATMMNENKTQLFTEDRSKDNLDRKGKDDYRKLKTDDNGDIYDDLTGQKEKKTTYIRNGKEVEKSDLQADHIQARESASYNSKFVSEKGREELKIFWNSSDNMQMMHASANSSKGDIRVCNVNGKIKYINARSKEYDASTDITYKATPEQLAEAVCKQWESVDSQREGQNQNKIEKLKEKGYLDKDGKVPKSVKKELIKNIRHSQNQESKIILKNAKYDEISKESVEITKKSIGKIISGQIIYYTVPPLLYEVRLILRKKDINLDNALLKIEEAAKRVGEYVLSKLKDIFTNIVFNSLKKFIKSFMDILIEMVKATVKKIMKVAKNLVVSTVDAIRIIGDKNSSASEKANAVCNLYAVTVTSCVVEVIFEVAADMLHIPEPFDDIVFGPLQIITTVLCTNLTMLILKKVDLFNVEFGFKTSQIRKLFASSREEMVRDYNSSRNLANSEIQKVIENAKLQSREIYDNLMEFDPQKKSARGELNKVNYMFSINIDFENEWLKFIGVPIT